MYRWLISIFAAVCLSFVPYSVQAEGSGSGKSVWDSVNDSSQKSDKEQTPQVNTANTSDSGSTFMMLVKLVFMLGVVLAILFFVLRFIQKKSVRFQVGKNLQSLGGIGIGQNRSVQLIKTGNSVLVVGVGDTVNLLKEITDETEVQMMLDQYQAQNTAQNVSAITSHLKSKWLKSKDEIRDEGGSSQTVSFKNMLNSIVEDKKEQQREIQKALEKGKHHE
ncbi:flagellar biosynthetic protein FliO [Fictibacillus sp. b24]|uniref:flagellar biosynthetic protein FliO n=1 Tax=Fictibacillus sp. b24 TaxID=3055863 RepID=UPI0025A217A6|nr:flagellar biosynthetic protein FliO [Fictibacillus sp. b24]MDM5316518.1 flagellar biosynthetic protein FliO [Fictibacillus sp. b24]